MATSKATKRALNDSAKKKKKAAEEDTLKYKNGREKSLTPKQLRARARRQMRKTGRAAPDTVEKLYGKPLEDWDPEELARGRVKDKNGNFTGRAPEWRTREMHEAAMERFKVLVQEEARVVTFDAVKMLKDVIDNDEVDEKGKPVVPYGVKVDVAKFLYEHLVGKAKQPITGDINVKLQGILANVMVDATGEASSTHRQIEGMDIIDAEIEEGESGT
jgi:hypothetical protein